MLVTNVGNKSFNPFSNSLFWDRPKFKEAADDNWNLANKGFEDTDCIENIVEKGQNIVQGKNWVLPRDHIYYSKQFKGQLVFTPKFRVSYLCTISWKKC